MSFGEDEEILQDFLVEAGEILDQLSEQLVDLERRPDDRDLLNAIFRGFHTVKGGAGFLQLETMVECCHVTENLFDILRNGKRPVTPELMDVVLQALDTVNAQFQQISQGQEPLRASPELLEKLSRLVDGDDEAPAATDPPQVDEPNELPDAPQSDNLDLSDDEFEGLLGAIDAPAEPTSSVGKADSDDITEEEFEALLDQLHGVGKGPATANNDQLASPPSSSADASESQDITEDEFEALLDQLHGSGKGPGKGSVATGTTNNSDDSDLISEEEFEALLDQLHGSGKGPAAKGIISSPPAKVPTPAGASEEKAPIAPEPPARVAPAASGAAPAKDAAPPVQVTEPTVRVDTQRLDDIMNMVGELVLVRNRLTRLGNESTDESLSKAVGNLDVVTGDLQSAVMKTRMQPIKKVFGRFPRVVRDLARNLKKEINLDMVGEDTDLDKNLVEALADPLVHLVRNSVDHGIELPEVRESRGKPRAGTVVLSAEQEGDHILLSISDNGAGMDPQKLRENAIKKGILDVDAASRLSDSEAFDLIFAPGFSTKVEVSDVSGRGVGLDVVKTKISQLNGSVEIQSKLGEGTRFLIKVPLTLAIMPTLMIMLGQQSFALPLVNVNEIFHMDLTKVHVVDGQECVTIREKAIPIFHLKRWLIHGGSHDKVHLAHVVIVSVGARLVGFVVDQLVGQEEVVIKPLGKVLHGTPGIAGATITGDGTIALILDVPSLLKHYASGR